MAISSDAHGKTTSQNAIEDLSSLMKTKDELLTLEKKCERMLSLLEALKQDLEEDISHASPQVFKERVIHQFRCYEEIANLRTSLKNEKLVGQEAAAQEKCIIEYKNFIQDIPPFRVAHELKISSLRDTLPKPDKIEVRLDVLIHKCNKAWRSSFTVTPKILAIARELQKCPETGKGKGLSPKAKAILDWSGGWKPIWRKIQRLLFEGYQRARSEEIASLPPLTWTTGTATPILICLLRMLAQEIGCPALICPGKFGEYRIAPLGGELQDGVQYVRSVNVTDLSGSTFPRISCSLKYARKAVPFQLSHELLWLRVYNKICPSLFFGSTFFREQIVIQRLLFARAQKTPGTDNALHEAKALLLGSLEMITSLRQSCTTPKDLSHMESHQKAIEDLIQQIETPSDRFQEMTDEERSLVTNSSGILFGSYTVTGSSGVDSDSRGESSVEGALKLGKDKDIQIAFVKDKDVGRVRQYMQHFPPESQIPVVSSKALYYLTAIWPQSLSAVIKS